MELRCGFDTAYAGASNTRTLTRRGMTPARTRWRPAKGLLRVLGRYRLELRLDRTSGTRSAVRSRPVLEPVLAYVEPLQVGFEAQHCALQEQSCRRMMVGIVLKALELGQSRQVLGPLFVDELAGALTVERSDRDLQ